jgi:hypothetical protein
MSARVYKHDWNHGLPRTSFASLPPNREGGCKTSLRLLQSPAFNDLDELAQVAQVG